WHPTWFELQKKWSSDIGCPDGVFNAFDIDAKINAAYVVLGLLYGKGDFGKTIEVAPRAGQDADCNPSTAGGVLGEIIGYNKISLGNENATSLEFDFNGKGIVLRGEAVTKEGKDNAILKVQITVDGQQPKTISMPTDYRIRSNDIFWQYDLPQGNHTVHVQLL